MLAIIFSNKIKLIKLNTVKHSKALLKKPSFSPFKYYFKKSTFKNLYLHNKTCLKYVYKPTF